MKYYISDLHIGHKSIIAFDQRPFFDLNEMHETIIKNWNSVVSNNDEVYILGDFAWKNELALEVLRQLKGKKYLILGNHDRVNTEFEKHFVWVKELETIKDGDTNIVLCHYPIAHWRNADYGYVHLYGHIHTGRDYEPFKEYTAKMKAREIPKGTIPYECYNVGCMMPYMNYTPRTLKEIRQSSNLQQQ